MKLTDRRMSTRDPRTTTATRKTTGVTYITKSEVHKEYYSSAQRRHSVQVPHAVPSAADHPEYDDNGHYIPHQKQSQRRRKNQILGPAAAQPVQKHPIGQQQPSAPQAKEQRSTSSQKSRTRHSRGSSGTNKQNNTILEEEEDDFEMNDVTEDYASNNSIKGSFLKFNSSRMNEDSGFLDIGGFSDAISAKKYYLSFKDDTALLQGVRDEDKLFALKSNMIELHREKINELVNEFKKKEHCYFGLINQLKMKNCDLIDLIGSHERLGLSHLGKGAESDSRLQAASGADQAAGNTSGRGSNGGDKCLSSKLKEKSSQFLGDLTSERSEMQTIIEIKSMNESRRKQIEDEIRAEIVKKETQRIRKELREKDAKQKAAEIEQIREIVRNQLEKKQKFLEENSMKRTERAIREKTEKLQTEFREKTEKLQTEFREKTEKHQTEFREKHEALERQFRGRLKELEKQKEDMARQKSLMDLRLQKVKEMDEEREKELKSVFEKKEVKYKQLIRDLSDQMERVQENVKSHFSELETYKKRDEQFKRLEEREQLIEKREKMFEKKMDKLKMIEKNLDLRKEELTNGQNSSPIGVYSKNHNLPLESSVEFAGGRSSRNKSNYSSNYNTMQHCSFGAKPCSNEPRIVSFGACSEVQSRKPDVDSIDPHANAKPMGADQLMPVGRELENISGSMIKVRVAEPPAQANDQRNNYMSDTTRQMKSIKEMAEGEEEAVEKGSPTRSKAAPVKAKEDGVATECEAAPSSSLGCLRSARNGLDEDVNTGARLATTAAAVVAAEINKVIEEFPGTRTPPMGKSGAPSPQKSEHFLKIVPQRVESEAEFMRFPEENNSPHNPSSNRKQASNTPNYKPGPSSTSPYTPKPGSLTTKTKMDLKRVEMMNTLQNQQLQQQFGNSCSKEHNSVPAMTEQSSAYNSPVDFNDEAEKAKERDFTTLIAEQKKANLRGSSQPRNDLEEQKKLNTPNEVQDSVDEGIDSKRSSQNSRYRNPFFYGSMKTPVIMESSRAGSQTERDTHIRSKDSHNGFLTTRNGGGPTSLSGATRFGYNNSDSNCGVLNPGRDKDLVAKAAKESISKTIQSHQHMESFRTGHNHQRHDSVKTANARLDHSDRKKEKEEEVVKTPNRTVLQKPKNQENQPKKMDHLDPGKPQEAQKKHDRGLNNSCFNHEPSPAKSSKLKTPTKKSPAIPPKKAARRSIGGAKRPPQPNTTSSQKGDRSRSQTKKSNSKHKIGKQGGYKNYEVVTGPPNTQKKGKLRLIDQLFSVGEGDERQIIGLKNLRAEIKNFETKDKNLIPKYNKKMEYFCSKKFILNNVDLGAGHNADLKIQEMNKTIKQSIIKLEKLWDECFINYQKRTKFLVRLEDKEDKFQSRKVKDGSSFELLRDIESVLTVEIERMKSQSNSHQPIYLMLKRREEIKEEINRIAGMYYEGDSLKAMANDLKPMLGLLRGLNGRVLNQISKIDKYRSGLGDSSRGGGSRSREVGDSRFRVLGVNFEVMARLDLWEDDYMRKKAEAYVRAGGEAPAPVAG